MERQTGGGGFRAGLYDTLGRNSSQCFATFLFPHREVPSPSSLAARGPTGAEGGSTSAPHLQGEGRLDKQDGFSSFHQTSSSSPPPPQSRSGLCVNSALKSELFIFTLAVKLDEKRGEVTSRAAGGSERRERCVDFFTRGSAGEKNPFVFSEKLAQRQASGGAHYRSPLLHR